MELALSGAEEEVLAEHAKLYAELTRYVGKKYSSPDYPERMRMLIFSLAYTYLCHQKKAYVARNLIAKTFTTGSKPAKEAHREVARDDRYEEACEFAQDHIAALTEVASNAVIARISSETRHEFQTSFRAHLPHHKPMNWWQWLMKVVIIDPGAYAIKVVLAGVLAALFLAVANLVAPWLLNMFFESIRDLVEHYVLGGTAH